MSKGSRATHVAANNRANQLNPNNSAYWSSRSTAPPAATPAAAREVAPPHAEPQAASPLEHGTSRAS